MTFKHKLKFIIAVLKGDVTKATGETWNKSEIKTILTLPEFKETMSIGEYITKRKQFLEKIEDPEKLEEVDIEYSLLEEIEKVIKTWHKTKI